MLDVLHVILHVVLQVILRVLRGTARQYELPQVVLRDTTRYFEW